MQKPQEVSYRKGGRGQTREGPDQCHRPIVDHCGHNGAPVDTSRMPFNDNRWRYLEIEQISVWCVSHGNLL